MAKEYRDWSNETNKDWAIIRRDGAYWVVPATERKGYFVMIDYGVGYLPLKPDHRAYPLYGPYSLPAARAKYADTDPRPLYAIRVSWVACWDRGCKPDCKGHEIMSGKWTEARARLHFQDWKQEKRVNQVFLLKDGKQIDQWHRQQAEEASKSCSK